MQRVQCIRRGYEYSKRYRRPYMGVYRQHEKRRQQRRVAKCWPLQVALTRCLRIEITTARKPQTLFVVLTRQAHVEAAAQNFSTKCRQQAIQQVIQTRRQQRREVSRASFRKRHQKHR